jgi:hypothetical protein
MLRKKTPTSFLLALQGVRSLIPRVVSLFDNDFYTKAMQLRPKSMKQDELKEHRNLNSERRAMAKQVRKSADMISKSLLTNQFRHNQKLEHARKHYQTIVQEESLMIKKMNTGAFQDRKKKK